MYKAEHWKMILVILRIPDVKTKSFFK